MADSSVQEARAGSTVADSSVQKAPGVVLQDTDAVRLSYGVDEDTDVVRLSLVPAAVDLLSEDQDGEATEQVRRSVEAVDEGVVEEGFFLGEEAETGPDGGSAGERGPGEDEEETGPGEGGGSAGERGPGEDEERETPRPTVGRGVVSPVVQRGEGSLRGSLVPSTTGTGTTGEQQPTGEQPTAATIAPKKRSSPLDPFGGTPGGLFKTGGPSDDPFGVLAAGEDEVAASQEDAKEDDVDSVSSKDKEKKSKWRTVKNVMTLGMAGRRKKSRKKEEVEGGMPTSPEQKQEDLEGDL